MSGIIIIIFVVVLLYLDCGVMVLGMQVLGMDSFDSSFILMFWIWKERI